MLKKIISSIDRPAIKVAVAGEKIDGSIRRILSDF